ncbi:MAG TPA: HAD-IIB family hydrolase [Candidatus Limnocylindria bacterium]|nr:HAD-IIB family hydrolase [Candidatus Limnocylindria bacterium]
MKISNLKKLKPKDLIVFDVDGTLARTKSPMDKEMAKLVEELLRLKKIALIGGGKYELFKYQFLNEFKAPKELNKNLFLFPLTSTTFLRYNNGWKKVYSHNFSKAEIKKIFTAFETVFKELDYHHPKKIYGKVIDNRGSQVTFSALGQDVVKILGKKKGVALKDKWRDENTKLKLKMAAHLKKHLPNMEVNAAGHTSIDVTKKGIDKAYGLKQIEKYVHVPIKKMLFVGDAIFPGGNDYAAIKTGVDYIPVKGPEDTKKIIRHLLA